MRILYTLAKPGAFARKWSPAGRAWKCLGDQPQISGREDLYIFVSLGVKHKYKQRQKFSFDPL